MKCTASITKLLCLLLLLLHHSWSRSSPFTSLWEDSVSGNFNFMTMLASKENIYHFLSLILTFIINNLQIYRTIQTPYYLLKSWWKRVLTVWKLRKESEKHRNIYCKNLIRFLFVVYSMVPVQPSSSSISWMSITSIAYLPSWISKHKKSPLI